MNMPATLTKLEEIAKIIKINGEFTIIVGHYQSTITRDGERLIVTKTSKDGWNWPDGPSPAEHNQLVIDEHGDMFENLADYGEEEQLYKLSPTAYHSHMWVAVDRNDWSNWYIHVYALIMRARLYDIATDWPCFLERERRGW